MINLEKHGFPFNHRKLLSKEFFRKYGFKKPVIQFVDRASELRVIYEIKGYDCQILISPVPQVWMEHVNDLMCTVISFKAGEGNNSIDQDFLEDHHIGNYQVSVNNLDNHVATFDYEDELFSFMKICGCPLKSKKK
jgi:hypothetical protein